METWQIILAIIIVGLSIIMPIYYSSEKKKKAQQKELDKLKNMVKPSINSLEIRINEKKEKTKKMTRPEPKYKKVDKWVHGEVKEIKLIGEDNQLEKGMHYFVFWINHNNQHRSTHVSHKELFDWFKIDQVELDNKLMKETSLDNI